MHLEPRAPVPVILTHELTASAKLLWLVLRQHATGQHATGQHATGQHAAGRPVGPALLEELSGLCRKTVLNGLAELSASGWYRAGAFAREPDAARVSISDHLLTNHDVSTQARLLYAQLQLVPRFTRPTGQFHYAELSQLTGARPESLRRAVAELLNTRWLEIAQENRRAPICFLLCNPVLDKDVADMLAAEQHLKDIRFLGEAVMRELLSLLVQSNHFQDNAAPHFLLNPYSDEYLQLDRFYGAARVGFEFNGPQHYDATDMFPEETSAQQQRRDLVKEALCRRAAVTLVVVHPEDLSVAGMLQKIPAQLPLRNLKGHERLVKLLDDEGDRALRLASRRGWRAR